MQYTWEHYAIDDSPQPADLQGPNPQFRVNFQWNFGLNPCNTSAQTIRGFILNTTALSGMDFNLDPLDQRAVVATLAQGDLDHTFANGKMAGV